MRKNIVYSMVLVFVLMGVFGLAISVQRVEASGTIYIRADGSVEGTTHIVSGDNVTYVLTADINDSIIVERSNIIIDGDGYTLTGPYTEIGFNLTDLTNVTIRNVNVVGFGYGIYLQSSTLNIILENNITFNEGNIYLADSSDNTITGNTITYGAEAFQLRASFNNTISGNSMSDNYRGVWFRFNSADNSVSGNNITGNTYDGIYLEDSNNNTVSGNSLVGNGGDGICFYGSHNNTISGNSIVGNGGDGVGFYGSHNNTISGNSIAGNDDGDGIGFYGSTYNSVSGNNITGNTYDGIYFAGSSNNTVSGNTIANNDVGLELDSSSDNKFFHNNLIDNSEQVIIYDSTNFWDDGYPSGGNYWNDFSDIDDNSGPYQNQTGSDGIWDHPYVIDENNIDHYPIVPEFPSFLILPLFMIATLLVVIYRRKRGQQG